MLQASVQSRHSENPKPAVVPSPNCLPPPTPRREKGKEQPVRNRNRGATKLAQAFTSTLRGRGMAFLLVLRGVTPVPVRKKS